MSLVSFHVPGDMAWSETIPASMLTPTVQTLLAMLQRHFPGARIDAWIDGRAGGCWCITVEGFCRVIVRNERIYLSGPVLDAGHEDDLPLPGRDLMSFDSPQECDLYLARLWER